MHGSALEFFPSKMLFLKSNAFHMSSLAMAAKTLEANAGGPTVGYGSEPGSEEKGRSRAEIDTLALFESVKQAANRFSGMGFWKLTSHKPYAHASENEEFVIVLKKNEVHHTRHVRGSNYCFMNVFPDRIPGRAIIISVIDNLVKGASVRPYRILRIWGSFTCLCFL